MNYYSGKSAKVTISTTIWLDNFPVLGTMIKRYNSKSYVFFVFSDFDKSFCRSM